jgi:two-component system, NarL family, nitrate/nitrite response regulator NarL
MSNQEQEEPECIRVLLIDAHPILREGLRLILDHYPHLQLVGAVGNRMEALALATREQPDVMLLDLMLNEHEDAGLELIPELLIAARQSHLLVLTGATDPEEHYRAVRLGAMGVILRDQEPEALIRAIESVHAGEVWLEPTMTVRLLGELLRGGKSERLDPEMSKITRLTTRERQVIALIGEGLKNKQIASQLFISEVTVRHHLTSIFNKLEVADRLELAMYAYQYGLAKPPFYGQRTAKREAPPPLAAAAGAR